jgi:hypothetical protein
MSNIEENNVAEVQEQKDDAVTAIESSSTQEDIFADIFGQQAEPIVATDPATTPDVNPLDEPSDVPSKSDPKGDPDQFQYWQSQADKRSAEVELLKGQVSELMETKASTPEEPVQKETAIEKPVKPSKPADYDHSEALADPESKSAKYLADREMYMDNMLEYTTELEAVRTEKLEQQQANQQRELSRQKLVNDLQGKYNYSNEQALNFIETMSSPESLSLDNLVQLHKMRTGNAPQEFTQVTPEAQEKAALMSNRQEKLSIPKPIGVQPGASRQSSKTVENQMMDSMVADFKKKNPF